MNSYDDDEVRVNKGFARKTAREILKKAHIKVLPILLKDISRFIPDLSIDGKELEDEISGLQISYKGLFFIRYNSAKPIKRNRFTVAHEIGHLILGHASPCSRDNLSKNNVEIEANQFAAELLMPLSFLKNEIKGHASIEKLSNKFWVSKETMSKRVLETNLYKLLSSW